MGLSNASPSTIHGESIIATSTRWFSPISSRAVSRPRSPDAVAGQSVGALGLRLQDCGQSIRRHLFDGLWNWLASSSMGSNGNDRNLRVQLSSKLFNVESDRSSSHHGKTAAASRPRRPCRSGATFARGVSFAQPLNKRPDRGALEQQAIGYRLRVSFRNSTISSVARSESPPLSKKSSSLERSDDSRSLLQILSISECSQSARRHQWIRPSFQTLQ